MLDEIYRSTEDMFLKALELIDMDEVKSAKELLEDIIYEEPDFGRAHSWLGWIYGFRMVDYKKSEYHLKIALKYAEDYPYTHHNFAYLLHEMNMANRLEAHARRSLDVTGVNKSLMYEKIGVAREMKLDFRNAIRNYKQAISYSMNDFWTSKLKEDVKRVKKKMNLLQKVAIVF
jgi:tetratricopeptide (TPR) repeat protein